jgi:hypothetical protein
MSQPAPSEVSEAGRTAALLCRERGTDISEVALVFCLDLAKAASTLVGLCTREHFCAKTDLRSRPLSQLMGSALEPSGRPKNHG